MDAKNAPILFVSVEIFDEIASIILKFWSKIDSEYSKLGLLRSLDFSKL